MKNSLLLLFLLFIPLLAFGQRPKKLMGPRAKNATMIERNQPKVYISQNRFAPTQQRLMKTKHTVRRRRTPLVSRSVPVIRSMMVSYRQATGPKEKNRRPERSNARR